MVFIIKRTTSLNVAWKMQLFQDEIPTCSFFIFISMVFKEFGGVGVFPFCEHVTLG